MQKKWLVKEQDEKIVTKLMKECTIDNKIARLLYNRNIVDTNDAKLFLNKKELNFFDPYLLPDMEKAVARIRTAIQKGERITIYGDYDVDGITSVCILYKYLKQQGVDVAYYIPDRTDEGYGLNINAIEKIKDDGTTLLITVDSGIMALEEADFAESINLDLIVTDHHECASQLPKAIAVVNPKRWDGNYPFKELAGVGVAFKLICALAEGVDSGSLLDDFSQLTAIGTISDVMPLISENRKIVIEGLKRMQRTENPGLMALIDAAGVHNKRITSTVISYTIAPRINAAGRVGDVGCAVELFLSDSKAEAEQLALQLCDENTIRRKTESEIMEEAEIILQDNFDFEKDIVMVIPGEGWHHGVIGIVASRISEKYCLPCILLSFDGEIGKGSGRSVKGFNLFEALNSCSDVLEKFGGHELAAGLSIKRENLKDFIKRVNDYARQNIDKNDLVTVIQADFELELSDINIKFANEIQKLEPFGMGNDLPYFFIKNVEIAEIYSISQDKNLRITLKLGDKTFNSFYFGKSSTSFSFNKGDIVSVIVSLDISNYRNSETVQFLIRDIKGDPSINDKLEYFITAYTYFKQGKMEKSLQCIDDIDESVVPLRDDFKAVFRYLNKNHRRSYVDITPKYDIKNIVRETGCELNLFKLLAALEIFEEMGLIKIKKIAGDAMRIELVINSQKVNLDKSKILQEIKTVFK